MIIVYIYIFSFFLSVKVYEGDDRLTEVQNKLEFSAGEDMKQHTNFWATVYNGERPPKVVTEIHQKKVGVKVEVKKNNFEFSFFCIFTVINN